MNVPNETFDLIREKQELDAFLSTFMTVSPPLPVEEAGESGPVPCIAPSPAIYEESDKPASVGKETSPDGMPETPVSVAPAVSPAEVEPVSIAEPVGAAAPDSGREESLSPEEEPEQRPEPPQNQAPPVFAELLPIDRPAGAPESRSDVPEMDRTLRLERGKLEAAASAEAEGDDKTNSGEAANGASVSGNRAKHRRPLLLSALLLCLALALLLLGYSWLRPSSGQGAVQWLSLHVPVARQYLEVGQPHPNPAGRQVGIVNLQQRLVRNEVLGREIRIIEGTAFNRGQESISGIRIRGELYDAQGRLAAARMSFCGSMMADDHLQTLGEQELRLALSAAQAPPQAYSAVPPGGQTPFMIVFIQEPPGIVRAMVEPVGMEMVR